MSNKIPTWDETTPLEESTPRWDDTSPIDETPISVSPITEQDMPVQFVPKSIRDLVTLGGKIGSPQDVEDVAKSVAQGASFGLSDELIGGARALTNAPSSNKSLEELYKQYRDIERQELTSIADRSPTLSMGAEIVGGIPSGGAALGALKGVGLLKKIEPLTRAGKVFEGAKSGATVGAAEMAGRSTDDTSEDALSGAGFGATIGATVPALGGLVGRSGKLLQSLKETETGRVFQRAVEGKKTVGEEALKQTKQQAENVAKDAIDVINDLVQDSKSVFNKVYSPDLKLDAGDLNFNFLQSMEDVVPEIKNSKNWTILNQRLFGPKGVIKGDTISGEDLQKVSQVLKDTKYDLGKESEIRDLASDLLNQLERYQDDAFTKIGQEASQAGNVNLANELQEAKAIWKTLSRIQEMTGLKNLKNISPEKRMQALDNLAVNIKSSGGTTPASEKSQAEIQRLMSTLETIAPERAKGLQGRAQEAASDYTFTRQLEKEPEATLGAKGLTILQRASAGLAQKAGEMTRELKQNYVAPFKQTIKPVTETIKKIPVPSQETVTQQGIRSSIAQSRQMSNKTNTELRGDAERLIANPKTKQLGEALIKALESDNPQLKDALINKTMQIPEVRQILSEE